jgi:hypothetical protein
MRTRSINVRDAACSYGRSYASRADYVGRTISEERQLPFTHPRAPIFPLPRDGDAITSPKNRLLPGSVCVRARAACARSVLVPARRGGYRSTTKTRTRARTRRNSARCARCARFFAERRLGGRRKKPGGPEKLVYLTFRAEHESYGRRWRTRPTDRRPVLDAPRGTRAVPRVLVSANRAAARLPAKRFT